MPIFIPLIALSLVACLSTILCWVLIKIAPKDAPDEGRKTQSFAVPTSGGLAIAAAIVISVCGILYLDQSGNSGRNHFAGLSVEVLLPYALLCLGVLIIGAIDDAKPLPTKPRLFGMAIVTLACATHSPVFDLVFLPVADSSLPLPIWLAIGGTALWIFVLMNASNFMDGSNGLAMGTLAIMIGALSFHLIGIEADRILGIALFVLGTVITAAIVGFLFWNLQGKLYAGDAGSLFGGTVFAILSIFSAQDGNIWFPTTLALPLLIDVFMTLLWRAKRGENLLTPHRHHAYQWLIKSGWSHIKTALLWWTLAAICAGAAHWAAADSKSMSAFVFFGFLMVGCTLWIVHRQRASGALSQTS